MQIDLLRHGAVQEPYQGKYNGHNDISISAEAKAQLKEFASNLQQSEYDAIYCSDLRRAKETLSLLNLTQKPIYSSALREESWGRHEGKSFEEIVAEGIEYENFEQWIAALDGESVVAFKQRVQGYFEETIFASGAKKILIVTHSGVMKMLLHLYKKMSLEEAFAHSVPYGELFTLEL